MGRSNYKLERAESIKEAFDEHFEAIYIQKSYEAIDRISFMLQFLLRVLINEIMVMLHDFTGIFDFFFKLLHKKFLELFSILFYLYLFK